MQGPRFFWSDSVIRSWHSFWSNSVIKTVLVHSSKCTTQIVTNEKQRKTELTNEKQRKTHDQYLDVSSKPIEVVFIIVVFIIEH